VPSFDPIDETSWLEAGNRSNGTSIKVTSPAVASIVGSDHIGTRLSLVDLLTSIYPVQQPQGMRQSPLITSQIPWSNTGRDSQTNFDISIMSKHFEYSY
jgi:hypothetical protein